MLEHNTNFFHLIFLVHGNHGHAYDMFPLRDSLLIKFQQITSQIKIICSTSNEKNTEVGIKVGGSNLAKEIINHVINLVNQNNDKIMLSIISHSLGGLFSRYCLKEVFENEICSNHLVPISFITLNSPHLGVRRASSINPFKYLSGCLIHGICNYFYKQTGADVILKNNVLMELAEDNNIKKFKNFTLVGLIQNDLIVPFTTSLLRSYNPFINYIPYNQGLTLVGSDGFNDKYLDCGMGKNKLINQEMYKHNDSVNNSVNLNVDSDLRADNTFQIEYSKKMLDLILGKGINIRRIYLQCGIMYATVAHDMTIKKGEKISGKIFDIDGCDQFLNLIADILLNDHYYYE